MRSKEKMNALIGRELSPYGKKYGFSEIDNKLGGKILRIYCPDVDFDDIIVFQDVSLVTNAKNGIVFTVYGFYYKSIMEKTVFIRYEDISSILVAPDKKGRRHSTEAKLTVKLSNGRHIDFIGDYYKDTLEQSLADLKAYALNNPCDVEMDLSSGQVSAEKKKGGLFNAKLRKEELEELKTSCETYNSTVSAVNNASITLTKERYSAILLIKDIEEFINTIAHTPKTFESDLAEIRVRVQDFNDKIKEYEAKAADVNRKSGTVAGVGVGLGASVAAFAPTAAMSIAMTFGTASTGVAISTLSGAAATNAALAWLGGGALAVGGGGMSAGSALLALAGPVGWTIGGVALAGSAFFASGKNVKIAYEAVAQKKRIEKATYALKNTTDAIQAIFEKTTELRRQLQYSFDILGRLCNSDYLTLSENDRYALGTLVNNTKTLAVLLHERVEDGEIK